MKPTDSTKSPEAPATNPPSSHAEFLTACERVAHIWKERAQCEAALWSDFRSAMATTRDFEEALQAYAHFSAQRMQMATDDMRRLFEEYQDITGRFPSGKAKLFPNSLFV